MHTKILSTTPAFANKAFGNPQAKPREKPRMIVTRNGDQRLLPDFMVIGAMRCGTTSLYTYLNGHPEIFMPDLKEPHFFSYFEEGTAPHPDDVKKGPWTEKEYLDLFAGAKEGQILGEASISYIYKYPQAIKSIRSFYGEATSRLKIIGVLRDPLKRAWSIYTLRRQGGSWKEGFLDIAGRFEAEGNQYQYYNFLDSGLYSQQVRAYQEVFPNCKFILFDELAQDADRIVSECLEFLGTEDRTVPAQTGKVMNVSGQPKKGWMAPLYRMVFNKYALKTALKGVLPEKLRFRMKIALGSKLVERTPMPVEVKEYLQSKFRDDQEKLAELFPDEKQKRIIRSWLQ